jgi:hypothetical protein
MQGRVQVISVDEEDVAQKIFVGQTGHVLQNPMCEKNGVILVDLEHGKFFLYANQLKEVN